MLYSIEKYSYNKVILFKIDYNILLSRRMPYTHLRNV